MKGKFISLEGIDACGKSTQTRMLCAWFAKEGLHYVTTREPGGSHVGDLVRNILRSSANKWGPMEQAMLLNAGRYSHTHEMILPHLNRGVHVVCDRYVDSTFAYQSALGAPLSVLQNIHNLLFDNLYPHMTLWLDVPPDDAWARVMKRKELGVTDAFEAKLSFQRDVYKNYCAMAKMFPDRIIRIDARKSVDVVFSSIQSQVVKLLGLD